MSDSKDDSKFEKIHVSGLRTGMYVSKLDVDWLDTPFLYQGFLIESVDDIEQLEKLLSKDLSHWKSYQND